MNSDAEELSQFEKVRARAKQFAERWEEENLNYRQIAALYADLENDFEYIVAMSSCCSGGISQNPIN